MKPLRLAPLLLLTLTACTGLTIQPERARTRSYELGQTQEATTGSTMIRVANAFVLPTFTPAHEIDPPRDLDYRLVAPLRQGERWVVTSRTGDGGYIVTSVERIEAGQAIHLLPDGRVRGWVGVVLRGGWPETARFVPHDDPVLVEGSFEAELVYSGLDGATLRLLYREYFDGQARPAFTQELTYNLDESRTIEFKSLKIDILEATNSLIRFRVTEDGGLPWLG